MTKVASRKNRSYPKALLALVKPRIIELLLVTAVPALVLAAQGWPQWQVVSTVVGFGTIAAAGANAWNSIIERDIDARMNRTKNRPLVTGEISVAQSVVVALVLSLLSVTGMFIFANFAAAALTAAAIGFYVLGYTILLKPRTDQNIVWGGIAGCFPVVIAESAVTGTVTAIGWSLFALIFFWTPAHYWPLAAHFKEDYSRANIPMLPVAKSPKVVAGWTLFYTVITIITSYLVFQIADLGLFYLTSIIVAGALYLYLSVKYLVNATDKLAAGSMELFHFSITYLAIVFLAIAVDVLV